MIGQKTTQKRQMGFAPARNSFVVIAVGDRAADHKQQNFRQGMRHSPRLAWVLDDGKMVEQRAKARFFSKF